MKRFKRSARLLPAQCLAALMSLPACSGESTWTNSIGMAFVQIPAGSFLMGSPERDREAADDEKPQHRVTLSQAFYLGKYEVTQAQWEAVMGSNPYTLARSNPYYSLPGMAARLRHPTQPATVSWNDAQEFIKRLNQKEGHDRYRLPTEAEWEYAARAGTTTAYFFGDDAKELGRYAWYGEDFATGSTHPVGQKGANGWGLYDVYGNVWEWTQDRYGDGRFYAHSPMLDPKGATDGSSRVVRGGSWHASAVSWRSAFRRQYEPDYRGISIGFRLAMTLPAGT
jgi:formylglycine-generating enzyme required for sulfatase activity